ncbi:MAG TPA: XRE family transcriptional regulator [Jeotgalicoccus sp.]|nr:XRE family transcriptional regulator [Jeotgalicoccus sp.]
MKVIILENFVESKLKKNLSIVLFKYRLENDISRKELASHLNISLNTLTSIENGLSTPSLNTLFKYANYFNTTISIILKRAESDE